MVSHLAVNLYNFTMSIYLHQRDVISGYEFEHPPGFEEDDARVLNTVIR